MIPFLIDLNKCSGIEMFFLQPYIRLYRTSTIRNIIMESGINAERFGRDALI